MACTRAFNFILCTFLLIAPCKGQTQSVLPRLQTKQEIGNIRFLAQSGKFTYFQRYSGGLYLSTNYKVQEVLKGKQGAQFTIFGSSDQKKLILTYTESLHTYINAKKNRRIMVMNFGESLATNVGIGTAPQLHLADRWVSFYDTEIRTLLFKSLDASAPEFRITITNRHSPYFVPSALMLSNESILFTDLNSNNIPGIISYNRKNGELTPFFKSKNNAKKLEICMNESSIFILEAGITEDSSGTTIYQFPKVSSDTKPSPHLEKFNAVDISRLGDAIYQSSENDIGQILCHSDNKRIFFVKNLGKIQKNSPISRSEIASLNLDNKQVSILSKFEQAQNIFSMDGLILTLHKGEYRIVDGSLALINDSLLINPPSVQDSLKEAAELMNKKTAPPPAAAPTPPTTPAASSAPAQGTIPPKEESRSAL